MSNPAASKQADPAAAVRAEARFGAAFLRKYRWRLLLLFIGLLLPLWAFAELADEVREAEAFPFDEPILRFAHALARDGFDQAFVLLSALGYQYGVVPFDALLVLGLAIRRRMREGLFAGVAIIGSALLNLAAKPSFARARPSLWESIAPETTFSFPSGHAMGSMTLAWVVVLLCWHTRWRLLVTLAAAMFTLLVGLSRVYLGVHYPSDIVAGWAAASVWAVGIYLLVFRGSLRPWRHAQAE
ncbi:phosphatase PAP2 family protein [Lysobacter sp. CFH 32150]|uniref:phosphatase PAP2 family protein n=1 Tax=Lysobacter sp. CFH 32150 TaxID=2927128 RepID=UPI001FA761C5|nr:phosphatase PAP2 family protein [Lysobacter sp. CFH 32150]MCI4567412.1 phosphatase PAP2 family protein [Lysobacter sp. CFH 32150]